MACGWILMGRMRIREEIRKRKKLFEFLKTKNRELLTGTPSELLEIDRKLRRKAYKEYKIGEKALDEKIFQRDVKWVFNYDNFQKTKSAEWFNCHGIKVCPYCNEEYLPVAKHKGKTKLLFDFDHFFQKETSLGLLSPSKTLCHRVRPVIVH